MVGDTWFAFFIRELEMEVCRDPVFEYDGQRLSGEKLWDKMAEKVKTVCGTLDSYKEEFAWSG